jgi:predicted Zn-dependent peptidase
MYKTEKLKNGLNCVYVPVAGTRAVTFMVLVPIGSRYETKKLGGASHFVEHLMFKGTKKRPTSLDISRELDSVGAQFNAFTNKDYTEYYIKINSSKSELALDILSDMLFNSCFDAEEIKKEKGVIIEEIKMYEDNPSFAVENIYEQLMFGDHPLGRGIAGTIKGIKNITRDELYDYFLRAYRPENMVLAVAGNIDRNIQKLIKKYYFIPKKNISKISKDNYQQFNWPKKSLPLEKRVKVQKRKIDQAHVIIGYPGIKITDLRRYALAVMMNILGGSMSSRLFVEVREKRGLAYKIRASAFSHRDVGGLQIESGLDTKRLAEAFATINNECEKMRNFEVSKKELNDAKNNLAGSLALSMEDSSTQASWYALKYWFENDLNNYQAEIKKIRQVTASEIKKLAHELLCPSKRRFAVISPFEKKDIIKFINN